MNKRWKLSAQGAGIVLVCVALFANTLDNSFHYDDEHSVQHNINLRSLGNIPEFFTSPGMFSVDADKGMYRPLLLVTYALNHAWGGYEVAGYHWVNISLHAANAALLAWLCWLLSGRSAASLLCGLLFAIYPLGTEPVNYVSSRSESLSALFFLAGLCFFVRAGPLRTWPYMMAAWITLVLGLLSKSTVITLPAVLLAFDYIFFARFNLGRFVRERFLPWHAVYWATAAAYLELIRRNGFLGSSLGRPVREGATQLFTQTKAFAYYAKLLLWPWGLNVEHQFFEEFTALSPAVLLAAVFLASFVVLLCHLVRARLKLPLFLAFWGIVSLLPVTVIPLNVLVNERRLYLACAAFCLGLGLMLGRVIETAAEKRRVWRTCTGALLLILASLSYARNQVWQSEFTLWSDAISKAPRMPRVHLYMGNAHTEAARTSTDKTMVGRHWKAAAASYRRAIEVKPNDILAVRSLNNLGSVNFELRNYTEAEMAYRKALELNPRYADALINLGNTYQQRALQLGATDGRRPALFETAIEHYNRALEILPNHAAAHGNMGFALFNIGSFERAEEAYHRALSLNPRDYTVLNNLGNLYATYGQNQMRRGSDGRSYFEKARGCYLQARQINPAYDKVRYGLEFVDRMMRSKP